MAGVDRQTVSRPELLVDGSDQKFRQLVSDLFTVSARMQRVRDNMAGLLSVSGPQYSILLAIRELQGARGVSVKDVAAHLHVTGVFITVETGKLVDRGLVEKRPDPEDRRRALLTLSDVGVSAIDAVLPELQRINDVFFGALEAEGFDTLAALMAGLVGSSEDGLSVMDAVSEPASRVG